MYNSDASLTCWLLMRHPLQRWNRGKCCQGSRAVWLKRNSLDSVWCLLCPACPSPAHSAWPRPQFSAGHPWESHCPGRLWASHHHSLRGIPELQFLLLRLSTYQELALAAKSSLSQARATSPVWYKYLLSHRIRAGRRGICGRRVQFEFSSGGTAPCVYGKW